MSVSIHTELKNIELQLQRVSDAPAREAEWLLEHVSGLDRGQQRRHDLHDLTAAQLGALHRLVARRARGEPLAYVLGEQPFWTLRLEVNPAVLIPRPETELVVERALRHLPREQTARLLDLGTGSGAIALAVAQERPNAQVLAVDQSAEALAVARRNAELNHLNNVTFLQSHWFSAIPKQMFTLILSNPPYIARGDPHLEATVLAHEPRLALIAGVDGLEAIRPIIQQAGAFLAPKGWLILEHGWQQASTVRQLLESAGFSGVASHADLAGHLRVTEAQAP